MNIKIITRENENPDNPPQVMIIDDADTYQNRWLMKHMWWAMRTNHTVTVFPTDKAVTFEDRRR